MAPVTAMRLPARSSRITSVCLPFGRGQAGRRDEWTRGDERRCEETTSTRDRILAAALSGFARRGVEATSLDAVAAEIGIRKQTILYYFPSKDALVKGVIEHAAAGGRRGAGRVGRTAPAEAPTASRRWSTRCTAWAPTGPS